MFKADFLHVRVGTKEFVIETEMHQLSSYYHNDYKIDQIQETSEQQFE